MVKGFEGRLFEEQLEQDSLVCAAWRRVTGCLITVYRFLTRGRGGAGADFSLLTSDMTKGNCMRQCRGG